MSEAVPALVALEAQVARDLSRIAHPRASWLEPRMAPDGKPALDVLVAGAGQSGLAVGFALLRSRVDNILLVDRAEAGQEGPWLTFARMHTLRSPKDFTGPDLDIPSLTYQSWYEARYGREDWDRLDQITRADWQSYLDWVRRMTGVPVRNGCALVGVVPEGDLLACTLRTSAGEEIVHTRKLVLATGQDGMGAWWMPEFVAALPARFRAHAADPIDFAALAGKRVAVLGAGASAFDNAATALEHGAIVDLFCRRATPQVVQPYRWLTFRGFLRHFPDLSDEWRWRFMSRVLGMREGFPQPTYDRCIAWPHFTLHAGRAWTGADVVGEKVAIQTEQGSFEADFLICGTGVDMDFSHRPELAACAGAIATWADRYTPPRDERHDRLARFPYLGADFSLQEKRPGEAPWLADVHVFAIASTMSQGPSGSSINAMTTAVPRLVEGLTRGLFKADLDRHWQSFLAYDVPQAVLRSSGPISA